VFEELRPSMEAFDCIFQPESMSVRQLLYDRLNTSLRGNCRKNLARSTGEHEDGHRVTIFKEQAHSSTNFGFYNINFCKF
jgi:hypothetical protein